MAGANFGLDRHTAQKIHLLKRVHLLPGCFLHRFDQPSETDACAVNEYVIDIWIRHMKQAKRDMKRFCQKCRVLRSGERTLREICWNQDCANRE
jgi:hypothetical protein